MLDLHADTVQFIFALLKKEQLQLARVAHSAAFDAEQAAYLNTQNRLLLELSYGGSAGDAD
jgi:hypothetical protein